MSNLKALRVGTIRAPLGPPLDLSFAGACEGRVATGLLPHAEVGGLSTRKSDQLQGGLRAAAIGLLFVFLKEGSDFLFFGRPPHGHGSKPMVPFWDGFWLKGAVHQCILRRYLL